MATKTLSELSEQLEALNNKELRAKCLEYGFNVPVADSSRDVIIRKLLKCMGAIPVASPRAGKKQNTAQENRRQTINVTVHVDDEDEQRAQKNTKGQKGKASPRTQSPRRQADTVNNNRQSITNTTQTKKAAASAAAATTPKQSILKSPKATSPTHEEHSKTASSKTVRIVPMEVDFGEDGVEELNIEVQRSSSNINDSFNRPRIVHTTTTIDDDEPTLSTYNYDTTPAVARQESAFCSQTNDSLFDRPRIVHTTTTIDDDDDGDEPAERAYNNNAATTTPRQESIYQRLHSQQSTANSSYDSGYSTPHKPPTVGGFVVPTAHVRESIYKQPRALSKSSVSTTSYVEECTPKSTINSGNFIGSPVVVAPDTVFKQPFAPTKSHVSESSYNQEDAKRLYPRLPVDMFSSPTPLSTPSESSHSSRASSLSKSGVMTTSYTQELSPTPVREVHKTIGNSGDGDYLHTSGGYDRTKYLSSVQRDHTDLPFEPQLQSTFRNSLGAISKPPNTNVTVGAATVHHYSPTIAAPYVNSAIMKETTTISDDEDEDEDEVMEEPQVDESFIDSEEDDASTDDYDASTPVLGRSLGTGKTTSSYGGTQIYERVPLRRSNVSKVNSSVTPTRYSGYQKSPLKRRGLVDDDVDASFRKFVETVDQKYHVKQMLTMFAIFSLAICVYVFFLHTPAEV